LVFRIFGKRFRFPAVVRGVQQRRLLLLAALEVRELDRRDLSGGRNGRVFMFVNGRAAWWLRWRVSTSGNEKG
jgi:hypothetical protein